MARLYVARRPQRRGLLLPMQGSKVNPSLLFPLDSVEPGELDELIRAILEKQGVRNEAEIQTIVEKAEQDSEIRIKVAEAKAEVRRLMKIRAAGGKLMQVGFRKWKQAFYRPAKGLSVR